MRGQDTEAIKAAKKVLKEEFGNHLTDNDIELLQTDANYYDPKSNIEHNASKRAVQRKVDLLN
ncbi:MAG: hypothetical protein J6T10_12465 [Methanobrevibacter sp.]|nr:hypothetical protein [Methanobrevibacter sp.]